MTVTTGPCFARYVPVYQNDKMNYSVRRSSKYWKVCVLVRNDGVLAEIQLRPAHQPLDDLMRDWAFGKPSLVNGGLENVEETSANQGEAAAPTEAKLETAGL
jgi:hypothetical protein